MTKYTGGGITVEINNHESGGWIEWHGGECPVPDYQSVDIRLSCGEEFYSLPAKHVCWTGDLSLGASRLVAYRLHETTEQRIDRLERELAELRDDYLRHQRKEDAKPEKWEPPEGVYRIFGTGEVVKVDNAIDYAQFGCERPTREQAEKARDAMRIHNRALAYVHEHAPDWEGKGGSCVYYDTDDHKWVTVYDFEPSLGSVTGPEWVMQKLADELNSGTVEL